MSRSLTIFAMLVAGAAMVASPVALGQNTPLKPATGQPGAVVDPITAHMSEGADALSSENYSRAAAEFQAAVALAPGNEQAQFWSGQALVYEGQSREAVKFLEEARKLGLDSLGLHLALVEAYAESGDAKHRDQERALLVRWRRDGKHPLMERDNGFRVEVIPAGARHVNVFQYFEPTGPRRDSFRFTVRDSAQAIEAIYVLDSDDSYQAEYAEQHSDEAAAGKRRYALVKYVGVNPDEANPVVYKYYNAEPDYDDVCADVFRAVKAQSQSLSTRP